MLQEERPGLREQLERRVAQLEDELRRLADDGVEEIEPARPEYDEYRGTLERFLEAGTVATIRANLEGEITDVNEAFTTLTGWTKEDAAAHKLRWDTITPPEWEEADKNSVEQLYKYGHSIPYEKEYICKDGHRVQVLLAVGFADPTGQDCFCFVIDLSERKRMEAELKLSEAQFRLLGESIPQMVFTVDADGKTEYFNSRWQEITGVQPGIGFEHAWGALCYPDDVPRVQEAWDRAVAEKKPFEIDARYKLKSGKFSWALVRAMPMLDPDGNILKWFGTLTDIDEQKREEEETRASEVRFRTLADAIPQIVWTADSQGNIDFFNHRWFEYSGLTIEQSLNNGWQLLIHPDDLQSYLREWKSAIRTGDTLERDFRLRRAVGIKKVSPNSYRRHLCRAVALHGRNGQVIKWFATWTEIESGR